MKKENENIYVTQPVLPDLKEFISYLEQIWENKVLTNNGPFHRELEKTLAEYLDVPYISLFANGTLALVSSLQALRISGEVITTPYSFVATTHSLLWNNIKPIFVDIEPVFCNLDPEKIESAITKKTTAILPVHVYGNPCNVDKIQQIADIYGLKVIYDAAHAFGVTYKGESILNYGDLSVLSFHATKVYNTFEGGAIICHDIATKKRIDYLKNFGFAGETKIMATGINSKMNEVQAAMGLLQLKTIKSNIDKRKQVTLLYREKLKDVKGISMLSQPKDVESNYAYFPIFINEAEYRMSRDELYEKMKMNNVYGRRYFYPLISEFSMYKGLESSKAENLPIATIVANNVICLPLYPDLDIESINKIINIIN